MFRSIFSFFRLKNGFRFLQFVTKVVLRCPPTLQWEGGLLLLMLLLSQTRGGTGPNQTRPARVHQCGRPTWTKDSSTARYCPVVAIWRPAARSAEAAYAGSLGPTLKSWGTRHELRPAGFPAAAEGASPGRDRCRSARRRGIRSVKKRKEIVKESQRFWSKQSDPTSDRDRTGGLTQSSQHLPSTVSSTIGGGTPSHSVRSCSWRRFSWQNISVRKAMNAVKRGRAGFLMFMSGPKT